MIVYERAGLLFVFNFNATQSYADYRVGVEEAGEYRVALSSDEKRFGGFDRVDLDGKYLTTPLEWNGRKNFLQVSVQPLKCRSFKKQGMLITPSRFVRSTSLSGRVLFSIRQGLPRILRGTRFAL